MTTTYTFQIPQNTETEASAVFCDLLKELPHAGLDISFDAVTDEISYWGAGETLFLPPTLISNIASPEATRYLTVHTEPIRKALKNRLRDNLALCQHLGASTVTCQLGLEQPSLQPNQPGFHKLLAFVRQLIPHLKQTGLNFCLPVRLPSDTKQCPLLENSAAFIYETGFPRFKLLANVIVHDTAHFNRVDPHDYCTTYGFSTQVFRFHLSADPGGNSIAALASWAAALHHIRYRGIISISLPPSTIAETRQTQLACFKEALSLFLLPPE